VDDNEEFDKLIDNARRIHILHGHYHPNSAILRNLDKIETYVMHNSVNLSMKAGIFSDSPGVQHYGADSEWENTIIKTVKKRIWIGLFQTPTHAEYDFIDIPNYYDFEHNLELSDSVKVGFAARTETRKRVWYLENVDCYLFTTLKVLNNIWEKGYGVNFKRAKRYMFEYNLELSDSVKVGFAARTETRKRVWYLENIDCYLFTTLKVLNNVWEKGFGVNFKKAKRYMFEYSKLDWFYRLDWGVSHSCFNYEPFGYSIFQAVDYGKLPILSKQWMQEWDYPYRAETKTEFEEVVKRIKNEDYETKKEWFEKLKSEMMVFTDRNKWVNNLLDIYNS
jgi:hypothetical protein